MKAQRVFAYIIDVLLIGILTSVICAISSLQIRLLWESNLVEVLYNPVTLVSLAVSCMYFLMDVLRGGSPGKKLLGLTVSAGGSGQSFGTALTRSAIKVLSIHAIIGIIIFLAGNEHTSLHDKIAGTRVEKKTTALA